jgi:chitodextrinase
MPLPKKSIAFATSAFLAASALTIVAATASTSASDPITCDANVVSLVVGNGSNQYFECVDSSAGAIRQTFSSKNPWIVDPAAPALFITPPATPDGAYGQIFTGRVQGVGVISSDDDTGAERDSISRNETLTFKKDALARNFSGLQLGVNVLQAGTNITVQAIDADGADITGGTAVSGSLSTGSRNVTFFSDVPVDAAGFRVGVTSGAFSLDGKRQTEFSLSEPDVTPPGQVIGLDVDEVTTNSVTLSWTNPEDSDLAEVIVKRDVTPLTLTAPTAESVTDTDLAPNTTYSYSVFTRDTSGNTSEPVTIPATTKPLPVTGLDVDATTVTSASLSWVNPPSSPPDEIIVRRSQGTTAPTTPGEGDPVTVPADSQPATAVTDTGLAPNTEYSYSVFTVYGTNISDPVSTSDKTDPGIAENSPSEVDGTFGGQSITSTVDFVPTDSCNADTIPINEHSVSEIDFELYTLSANWVVPDKDHLIPPGEPNAGSIYGNCLFRWTTTAVGVDYSLTPLMDYDGDTVEVGGVGDEYEPEAIPGCEYPQGSLVLPPKDYVGDERPFCLETDLFDGPTATKTTTVLVWNDPKRFT